MNKRIPGKSSFAALTFFIAYFLITVNVCHGATFTVTSSADGTTTDGVSLRWAITQVNSNYGTADTVLFNIAGVSPHIISINTLLPSIYNDSSFINGSSQPANGYSGSDPKIILQPVSPLDSLAEGLYYFATQSGKAQGMWIRNFLDYGINIFGSLAHTDVVNCELTGNGENGIYLVGSLATAGISGCAVTGNGKDGIYIFGSDAGATVKGNSITLNGGDGIYVLGAGATADIEKNVISSNMGNGVYFEGNDSCIIKGNKIGTDSTGTLNMGNALDGLQINENTNFIGGPLPGDGNVIAYNGSYGLEIMFGQFNLVEQNSFFCNTKGGMNLWSGVNNNYPAPVILNASATGANGTSSAYAKVELFYTDDICVTCQGKIFIADIYANSSGQWTYINSLSATKTIVATAIDTSNNNSSNFSNCLATVVIPPAANFQSGDTGFCANDCINYTDLSTGSPTSWLWSFAGGTPSSSIIRNPQGICYGDSGNYDVTLIVSNSAGKDTLSVAGLIHVFTAPPPPTVTESGDTLFCSFDPSYSGYQWYVDTSLIAGATNSSLLISTGGNYNVKVTSGNGCSTATGINTILGMNQFTVFGLPFTVSPNPSTGKYTVKLQGSNCSLYITNVVGEMIYETKIDGSEYVIDLSSFPAGIYLLQIRNEKSAWTEKLIKQ